MKILIVNKFLYPNGGSEKYTFELGKQFELMGHKVQYFGMEHQGRIVENAVNSYTKLIDFHNSSFREKITYPFKIIYSQESKKKIRSVLEDFRPDVVHMNNINFQITPSIIEEIRNYDKYIPIIYTAHDSQWVCPNHMMLIPSTKTTCDKCTYGNSIYCIKNRCIHNSLIQSIIGAIENKFYRLRHTYREVDRIICPSTFIKLVLDRNPDLRTRTLVMQNFFDKPKVKRNSQNSQKYVLFYGRYSLEKGFITFLKAAAMLPQIKFVCAGKGEEETKAQEYFNKSNIENVGFKTGDELYQLIANAEFTVFASEVYENCPYSVIEPISLGTPVIASKIGGTIEIVKDEITGEFYSPGNVSELSNKILNLWNDDKKLKYYRSNCENESFTGSKQYCEQMLTIYKSVISDKLVKK